MFWNATYDFEKEQVYYEELTQHQKLWADPKLMREAWKKRHPNAWEVGPILDAKKIARAIIKWVEKPLFADEWKMTCLKTFLAFWALSTIIIVTYLTYSFLFKLYVSNEWRIFVFDLLKGIWFIFLVELNKFLKNERLLTLKYNHYIKNLWKNIERKYYFTRVRYINWKWKNEWAQIDVDFQNEDFYFLDPWRVAVSRGFFQTIEIYFLDLTVYWCVVMF